MPRRDLTFILLAAMCAACFGTFWPALSGEFLTWDDPINVTRVNEIRGLGIENLRWMFFGYGPDVRYKPLTFLTWAVLYWYHGLDPHAFHLANVVLHCANTCLLFALLQRLATATIGPAERRSSDETWRMLAAAAIALLWAVHPLRVETTAWISVTSYLLTALFLQLAMFAFVGCDRERALLKQRRFWVSVLLFQASMMSFPTAVGGSFVFLALAIFPLRLVRVDSLSAFWSPESRAVLWSLLPFFVLTAIMVGVGLYGRWVVQGIWGAPQTFDEIPVWQRALGATYFFAYYLWRPFYPFKQFTLNEDLLVMSPTDVHLLAATAMVVALAVVAFKYRRSAIGWFAAWVAYVGLIAPIMKVTGESPGPGPGDRYSLLLHLVHAIGLFGLLVQYGRQHRHRFRIVAAVALVALPLAILSHQRSRVWRSDLTFYGDQTRNLKGREYLAAAHIRVGQLLIEAESFRAGMEEWEKAWSINPKLAAEELGLIQAGILLDRRELPEAIAVLELTAKHRPDDPSVLNYLGNVYFQAGEKERGAKLFERSIADQPDSPEPFVQYVLALFDAGDEAGARRMLERARRVFPNSERLDDVQIEIEDSAGPREMLF